MKYSAGRVAINRVTPMYSDYRTTEWLLTQWGIWANINAHPRHDFPRIEPYERMRRVGGLGCAITDADDERVDAIISTMAQAHSNQQLALVLYYKNGLSYRGVARAMKTNPRRVSDLLNGGRMWVDGAIQGVATVESRVL